jgi:cobalt transporter subunit CbtA
MFRNLVFAALAVGIFSGLLLALVQQVSVTPTILAAEVIENNKTKSAPHSHEHGSHHHDPKVWAPKDGGERIFYTVISNILAAIGFALLVLSAMVYSGKVHLKDGVMWGLAGYFTFFVAPAMGLPPEIPGMEAADLQGRQGWWLVTTTFTAAGIALIAFGQISLKIGGFALLLIPHVIGAPMPEVHGFGQTNEQTAIILESLSENFIQASAIANGIFWLALGVSSSYLINRFKIIKISDA